MSKSNEDRQARNRLIAWQKMLARQAPPRPPSGTPRMLGTVIDGGNIPTEPGHYCLFNPTLVGGLEAEGEPGTFEVDTTQQVAGVVLGTAPVVGDVLVFKAISGRWVAYKLARPGTDTGKIGIIPNCFCTAIPGTLTMTSADPNCNFKMFQSCTIQWGPTPDAFAPLAIGENTFLSTEGFPDPITNGAIFYYFLVCQYNQFSLTRIYPESPYGSPYRDGVLYSWLVGAYGNTCDPFHLDNGRAFPGSDPSCIVTIDG